MAKVKKQITWLR